VKFKAGDIPGALAAYEELIQHEHLLTHSQANLF
jgi:hypothetical protein